MAIDTLFQPVSGAGTSSSGDYVKDHFLDTSRPATNNTNLTSSASTNPLGFYFNNTDTPTYGVKTLYIKDAVLIDDRSKWINSKPTYEISFNEYNPAIRAYAVGNIRVRNSTKGRVIELRSVNDIFGVTGVINQLAWNLAPSTQSSASALAYTDGVSGSTFNVNSQASDQGAQGNRQYNLFLHSASSSSTDIHDFRLQAQQAGGTLAVEGIVCYFSASNIVCRPGSTYNDKNLITTSVGATLPLATLTQATGAQSVIYKSSTGTYVQSTNTVPGISSIAIGSSGTNLLSVTTGTGASFAVGYGVVAASGSSQYYGVVSNVSTDTLTVGPTLAIGISGAIYKAFAAGPTFAISASMYALKNALDPYELNNVAQTGVFGATLQGEMYFGSLSNQYYVWGKDLQFQSIDGYIGLGFEGNTSAFLQVDGNFSAADIEYMGNGILNATFSINGAPAWSVNSGSTGLFRATVFTDGGPGWNSFVMSPGQSHTGVVITKINLYDLAIPAGVTAGLLSQYQSFENKVTRAAANATLCQLGPAQRVYADQLFLQGGWTRGVSHIFAGNVAYFGATANAVMNFQYFGKDFALLGTEGGSMTLTIDGASIGSAFGAMKSVASMTWHTLALTYKAGATCILQALDFERPTQGELVSLQQKEPRSDLKRIPQTFIQSDTPREAKDGDVWVQQKVTQSSAFPSIWFKLFGQWNRAQFNATADDPNTITMASFGGITSNTAANVKTDGEQYNGVAWVSISNMITAAYAGATSDTGYNFSAYVIDGQNASGTVILTAQRFTGASWTAITNRGTAKSKSAAAAYGGFLTVSMGSTDGGNAGVNAAYDLWNGSAWASGTNYSNGPYYGPAAFVTLGLLSTCGGTNGASSFVATQSQKNAAGVNSTATTVPVSGATNNGTTYNGQGILNNYGSAANATAYIWSGAAWSSAITIPVTLGVNAGNGAANTAGTAVQGGGYSGSADVTTSVGYNGSAYYLIATRSLARGTAMGGTLGI